MPLGGFEPTLHFIPSIKAHLLPHFIFRASTTNDGQYRGSKNDSFSRVSYRERFLFRLSKRKKIESRNSESGGLLSPGRFLLVLLPGECEGGKMYKNANLSVCLLGNTTPEPIPWVSFSEYSCRFSRDTNEPGSQYLGHDPPPPLRRRLWFSVPFHNWRGNEREEEFQL